MGRTGTGKDPKSSKPSPSHSSSSSSSSSSKDFEFTISISSHKSSTTTTLFSPADELFYKGQLLPLHLSPRISMLRTILLSSTSSSPRSSNSSSNDLSFFPDSDSSSRPSSATQDQEFKPLHNPNNNNNNGFHFNNTHQITKTTNNNKYFSFSRFSPVSGSSVKRMSNTAKEVIRKYLKKVKPLYEKFSQKQQQQKHQQQRTVSSMLAKTEVSCDKSKSSVSSHSFSGNLRYPRRRKRCVSSCPSSPSHSGVLLSRSGFDGGTCYGDTSSVEELHSAIQGAIAHCKNSLAQNKTMVDQ